MSFPLPAFLLSRCIARNFSFNDRSPYSGNENIDAKTFVFLFDQHRRCLPPAVFMPPPLSNDRSPPLLLTNQWERGRGRQRESRSSENTKKEVVRSDLFLFLNQIFPPLLFMHPVWCNIHLSRGCMSQRWV